MINHKAFEEYQLLGAFSDSFRATVPVDRVELTMPYPLLSQPLSGCPCGVCLITEVLLITLGQDSDNFRPCQRRKLPH